MRSTTDDRRERGSARLSVLAGRRVLGLPRETVLLAADGAIVPDRERVR